MAGKIYVIGIGPGTEDYLLPIARKTARKCDVLVGGNRALDLFADLGKETRLIKGQLKQILNFLKANHLKKTIGVLVSGDPGFYSLLSYLQKNFPDEELEVIPGISSVQLAFARIKETWQNAELGSFHGRNITEALKVLSGGKRVFAFLTDPEHTPQMAAKILLSWDYKVSKAYVCQSLGYPNELICELSLTELAEDPREFLNSILVLMKEG